MCESCCQRLLSTDQKEPFLSHWPLSPLSPVYTMGRVEFYALWSLLEAPRQLISKGGRMSFQLPLPLPLPKQLIVFGLGEWSSYTRDTCITVQLVTGETQKQPLGTLSADSRSLVWEGEWSRNIVMECVKLASQGIPAKLSLTVTGQVLKAPKFSSSTPARRRLSVGVLKSPLLSESTIVPVRAPEDKSQPEEVTELVVGGKLKDSPPLKKAAVNLPLHSKQGGKGGQGNLKKLNWKPKNPRRLRFSSRGSEEGSEAEVCPSPRWYHSICLCDPETAILIGGEGANQQPCKDSLWKLEIDSDFWFPMDELCAGPSPQSSRGHTATFDLETKKLFVFGGMRDRCNFNNVYILDTVEWKWTLVTAVGKVPTLTHHSATMYQRELYVFGGLCPQSGTEIGGCSNSLYIFNPDYNIWYQPIVEGERPLPRFGHTATLLGNRVVIFGGRRSPSPVYLNDLYILDLGYMEYSTVSTSVEKPSPRSFHAAVKVSDHKFLVHGGCSLLGPLSDAFIFDIDTLSWCSVKFGDLPPMPRAGHTLLNLTSSHLTDADKEKHKGRSICSVLIIGGSDASGTFYCDNPKLQLELD
ncbi:uncharacterized protein LOC108698685 isoform X2 [Xenopus laevis]|uniref:Uncharacterized protein n=2 Tax=Xenopus laevis TaxID=8355 RepID=A0A974C7X3_XENLA|nr:uncharacterized protein LOC108698685 isoform X2 [Xenopus laevis]OCT68184.1 hypothetical protein XELAEV_18039480mg [Xenopus laevis]